MWMLLLLCLSASASKIDKAFQPFVDDFIRDSHGIVKKQDFAQAEIKFEELGYTSKNGGVIGYCTKWWQDYFVVEIDRVRWSDVDEPDRWQLIYHELGHCICNREHTIPIGTLGFLKFLERNGIKHVRYEKYEDGCEKSLMHPYDVATYCVHAHRTDYLKEMFDHCEK